MPAVVDPKKEALWKLKAAALERLKTLPAAEVAAAKEKYKAKTRLYWDFFPDTGPLRRELYPRHLDFFRAGKEHAERFFIAGNRTGKSRAAAFEVACHMTGWYPDWWEGRRFTKPTSWWTANESWQKVKNINQRELFGDPEQEESLGTGAIPAHLIVKTILNPHIKNGFASAHVRHSSGGICPLAFKTYEQGWKEFEGEKVTGGVWLDEHCATETYSSSHMRTLNTEGGAGENGIVLLTFTPLEGLTPLIIDARDRAVNAAELGW